MPIPPLIDEREDVHLGEPRPHTDCPDPATCDCECKRVWERAGRPSPSPREIGVTAVASEKEIRISLATEEARAVAHTIAPGVNRSTVVLVCRDCGAEVERGQHCKAAGCPARPGFTEEQADRKVLSVARDLLRRARIRLVDEPSAKELDAEIVAFLGKCPGATTGGSQRCTREQNHPGRCFDGKRTFVDRDPPSREVSYAEQRAEERAAQKSKE